MFYIGMCVLYVYDILPIIILLFFISIVFHRLSNILHHIIDRLDEFH